MNKLTSGDAKHDASILSLIKALVWLALVIAGAIIILLGFLTFAFSLSANQGISFLILLQILIVNGTIIAIGVGFIFLARIISKADQKSVNQTKSR